MKNQQEHWIGILGHYGNKNYGDEAIIAAVIQNIRQFLPQAQIACFSINPDDSRINHQVESYPIRRFKKKVRQSASLEMENRTGSSQTKKDVKSARGLKGSLKNIPLIVKTIRLVRKIISGGVNLPKELRFLKESLSTLKKFDLLIVSGSNQFLDNFGGAGGFPYTLLKWTVLCKLAKVKIAYAGIGAGPLALWRSKFYIHLALLMADYLSYRDAGSKALVEKTIFPIDGLISPDLAHSLKFKTQNPEIREKLTVGINPMPVYDSRYWYIPDEHKYEDYVNKLVTFSSWVVQQGYELFFFNTMIKDLNVVDDILTQMEADVRGKIQVKKVNSVAKLMETIDSADLTVATRFHGFVLSLLAEKPLLGICYYRKSREIMNDMGQGGYAFDIDDFSVEELKKGFEKLVQNLAQEKEKIILKNREYSERLNMQYEKIVKLIQNKDILK